MQRPAPKIDIGHSGETAMQAMEKFRAHLALCESYNQVGKHPIDRLTVIHGYGSTGKGGSIQTRLRKFLTDNHIEFQVSEGRHGAGTTTVLLAGRHAAHQDDDSVPKPLSGLDQIVEQARQDHAAQLESEPDQITQLRTVIQSFPRAARAEKRLLQATKAPRTATELRTILADFDENLIKTLIRCLILEATLEVQAAKLIRPTYAPKKH